MLDPVGRRENPHAPPKVNGGTPPGAPAGNPAGRGSVVWQKNSFILEVALLGPQVMLFPDRTLLANAGRMLRSENPFDRTKASFFLAQEAFRLADPQRGLSLLEEVERFDRSCLEKNPEDRMAKSRLAEVLGVKGQALYIYQRYEEANSVLTEALSLAEAAWSTNPDSLSCRVWAHYFRAAARLSAENIEGHFGDLTQLQKLGGEVPGKNTAVLRCAAYRLLEASTKLSPENFDEGKERWLALSQKMLDERWFQPVGTALVRLQRAIIFGRMGDNVKALDELMACVQQVELFPESYLNRWARELFFACEAFIKKGDEAFAAEQPRHVKGLNMVIRHRAKVWPSILKIAYGFRARIFLMKKDPAGAEKDLRAAYALVAEPFNPIDPAICVDLANIIFDKYDEAACSGKDEAADEIAKEIEAIAACAFKMKNLEPGDRAFLRACLAHIGLFRDDFTRVLLDLNYAIACPEVSGEVRVYALRWRSDYYVHEHEFELAEWDLQEAFSSAKTNHPQRRRIMFSALGFIRLCQGEFAAARIYMEQILAMPGTFIGDMLFMHLALVYIALQEKEKAIESWDKFKKDALLDRVMKEHPVLAPLVEGLREAVSARDKEKEASVPAPVLPAPREPREKRKGPPAQGGGAPGGEDGKEASPLPMPPAERGRIREIKTNSGFTIRIIKEGAKIRVIVVSPDSASKERILQISRSSRGKKGTIDVRKVFNQPNDGIVLALLRRVLTNFIPD